MALAEAIRPSVTTRLDLGGEQWVDVRLLPSKTAHKLRIKVSLDGVAVVVPAERTADEARRFVQEQASWVNEQRARLHAMQGVRKPLSTAHGEILFRGEPHRVQVVQDAQWLAPNRVRVESGVITITSGPASKTAPTVSLQNWLRREARISIEKHLAVAVKQVRRKPLRVYVMGQRTKWGNCSALGNLSFNWRLVMAPDEVMRYLVTHEVVHLAVPDHSAKFWLTVQSLCPTAERSRQWLAANAARMLKPLSAEGAL